MPESKKILGKFQNDVAKVCRHRGKKSNPRSLSLQAQCRAKIFGATLCWHLKIADIMQEEVIRNYINERFIHDEHVHR